jgi:hypothetical protein
MKTIESHHFCFVAQGEAVCKFGIELDGSEVLLALKAGYLFGY